MLTDAPGAAPQPSPAKERFRNAFAVVPAILLLLAAAGTASASVAGAMAYLCASGLLLLLTSPGRHWRRRHFHIPGFALLPIALILTFAGTMIAGVAISSNADDRFKESGEKLLAEAKAAMNAGNGPEAQRILQPIIAADDPRIHPLELAAEEIASGKNKEEAVQQLLKRGFETGNKESFFAAADAIDPQLRLKFLPKIQSAAELADLHARLADDDRKYDTLFSEFDGSVLEVKRAVKESMNDPSSFKHVETRAKKGPGRNAEVFMKYRGTNKFGAVVTEEVRALVDLDGKLLLLETMT